MLNLFDTEKGHRAWMAFNMCTEVLQQMMTLFVNAVCSLLLQDMLRLLSPDAVHASSAPARVAQDTAHALVVEDCTQIQDATSEAPGGDTQHHAEGATVDSAVEASVLDWLYDNMVRQVIEQSQAEARLSELTSDWVVDDFD